VTINIPLNSFFGWATSRGPYGLKELKRDVLSGAVAGFVGGASGNALGQIAEAFGFDLGNVGYRGAAFFAGGLASGFGYAAGEATIDPRIEV
jgi:hypothetical protein